VWPKDAASAMVYRLTPIQTPRPKIVDNAPDDARLVSYYLTQINKEIRNAGDAHVTELLQMERDFLISST